jgi:hypothetical protein
MDSVNDRVRGLAGEKVPSERDQPALEEVREVARRFQHDRRYGDRWLRCEALLDLIERGGAGRVVVSMAIRVDCHFDEIGIVEANCSGREIAYRPANKKIANLIYLAASGLLG